MSNIVLIENVAMVRHAMKTALIRDGYNVFDFEHVDDWLKNHSANDRVDLAIFSANDEHDTNYFFEMKTAGFQTIPVVFLVRNIRKEQISWLSAHGVVDFVVKPVDNEQLVGRIKRILPASISFTLDELIQLEMERARRGKYPFSLLYIGLEDYPNDIRQMFRNLEKLKSECLTLFRNVDSLVILGNTLIVLLPFTHKQGAQVVIEKVTRFMKDNEARFPYRYKIGGATFPDEGKEQQDIVELAKSRMINDFHTKELVARIWVNNLQREQHGQLKTNVLPAQSFGAQNSFWIQAKSDAFSVQLMWDNSIGSKFFEIKRYSGSVLDFSRKVFINRYLDNYARSGMIYTYVITGMNKHTNEMVDSSIQVHVDR